MFPASEVSAIHKIQHAANFVQHEIEHNAGKIEAKSADEKAPRQHVYSGLKSVVTHQSAPQVGKAVAHAAKASHRDGRARDGERDDDDARHEDAPAPARERVLQVPSHAAVPAPRGGLVDGLAPHALERGAVAATAA